MNKKNILFILLGIVFLATILRFWQLGKVPVSPDWDEAALGYNAYSIMQTGKDEYGKFLPVVLRSFDDYKPALYMYLTIPAIFLFDLSVFAVRFPSAFFGVVGVIAVFFLIRELFKDYKYKNQLALLASTSLAISPWDIQFSRVAFESHTGAVFNILTALFFIKGLKKPWFLIPSAIFAGLNIYLYQSEKVFTPLFVLLLILIFAKQFFKLPKKYLTAFVLTGVIIVLPMIFYLLTNKEGLMRLKGTSVFSSQNEILKESISKLEYDNETNNKLGLLFDNRRIIFAKEMVSGYLSHYDLNWLFIRGDLSRHHAPNMGLLYLWQLPFILIGLYSLIFGVFNKKTKLFIFSWFLLSPIPASITTGVPHAVRTMNFLPTFEIFTAIGLITAVMYFLKYRFKLLGIRFNKLFFLFIVLFISFNFIYYLNQYFVQQNYYTSKDWQYGWEKIVPIVKKESINYKKIIVSDKQPLDRSYMFFAFYLKYPPSEYQKYAKNQSGGFAEKHYFDKYEFRPLDWNNDSKNESVLFVGKPDEFPAQGKNLPIISSVKYLNGEDAILVIGK